MKKIIIVLAFLILVTNVLALQEVAGTIIISTPIGGSNSSRYGLMNDGNETITVSLRADGDVAKYLSFPATVDLEPNKLVYTNITATIPSDYSSTGNITGYLYALQEGSSGGQVQINVQMMKMVIISVYGQPDQVTSSQPNSGQPNQVTSSGQTTQGTSSQPNEANTPSGLITMIANNYPIVILVIVIFVLAIIIIIRIRRDSW